MEFAWPAAIGVLLLLAGLAALGFDSFRRRRTGKRYEFPELETTLLAEEGSKQEPVGSVGSRPLPYGRGMARPYRLLPTAYWLAGVAVCSVLLVGVGVAALASRGQPEPLDAKGLVIGLAEPANAPAKNDLTGTTTKDIAQAAAAAGLQVT